MGLDEIILDTKTLFKVRGSETDNYSNQGGQHKEGGISLDFERSGKIWIWFVSWLSFPNIQHPFIRGLVQNLMWAF